MFVEGRKTSDFAAFYVLGGAVAGPDQVKFQQSKKGTLKQYG
jgi:hypothetical protein